MNFSITHAISTIKEAIQNYTMDNIFIPVVLVLSIIVIVYFEKEKIKKYLFGYYGLLCILVLMCPLTYIAMTLFLSSTVYYNRLFFIIPIPILIPYAFVLLVKNLDGIKKLIASLVFIIIVCLCGETLYEQDFVLHREGGSGKVPLTCYELVHIFEDNGLTGPKKMLVTDDICAYIRQLDSSIILDNARTQSDKHLQIGQEIVSKDCNVDYILDYVRTNDCDYFMVSKSAANMDKLQKVGCTYIGETTLYYVFKDDYHTPIRQRDYRGNVIKETYIDENGNLYIGRKGYAECIREYDKRGYLARESYFDENLKPMSKNGYYTIRKEYNYRGNVIKESYYDENDNLLLNSSNYASIEYDRNPHGLALSKSFFDDNDELCLCKDGYASVEYKYNGTTISSEKYFDVEGNKVLDVYGESGYIKEFNSNKQLIKLTYLDLNSEPVMTTRGYSLYKIEYKDGLQHSYTYYDENDNPVMLKSNYYGYLMEYDENKRLIKQTYIDTDNNPTNITSGYSYFVREYDEKGNKVGEFYFDKDNNPAYLSNGCCGYIYEYNKDNRLVNQIYVDENRQPIIVKDNNYNYRTTLYLDNGTSKTVNSLYGAPVNDLESINECVNYLDNSKLIVDSNLIDYFKYLGIEVFDEKESDVYYYLRHSQYDDMLDYMLYNGYKYYLGTYNISNEILAEKGFKLTCTSGNYYLFENTFCENNLGWHLCQYEDWSNNQGMFYTLCNYDDGYLIVVDGGWPENASYVKNVIKKHNNKVDAWILTHYHKDHIGAFVDLMSNNNDIDVDNIYVSPMDFDYYKEVAQEHDNLDTLDKYIETTKEYTNINYLYTGDTLDLDGLCIEVLSSANDFIKEVGDYPNNAALCFKAKANEESILFMSDVHTDKLANYLVDNYDLSADYIQLGHHGWNQIDYSFYDNVNPKVAFFDAQDWEFESDDYSCEQLKEYLKSLGIKTYRFKTAPNTFKIK